MPSNQTKNAELVALYGRYSSDLQSKASIEDQLRMCRELAAKEGWHVAACYTDHAISGASLIRPGIQELMQDAAAGKITIILAESLDRLSRDQEDINHIYKRMRFAGVKVVTLAEGEVDEMKIGFKGTMGALHLKDLADKTRRGLRGLVEVGRSGGGNSYGYDVVKRIGDNGEPLRGERRINPQQAAIVRRIFGDYAKGLSPRTIAKALNREGVPGPSGKGWGPSTINGNRQRGTGILNNEMYVGKRVWNRLRYVKDPDTGKRVSRLNPASEWIIKDAPELRIVDHDLWDRVKARQSALEDSRSGKGSTGYWDRRRPKYLLSGLMTCGVCGGGAVTWNGMRIGCASARNKGICTNKLTMRRDELEAIVLEGLQNRLMDPALVELFCDEYARHVNRLRMERNAGGAAAEVELIKLARDRERLIQAIKDGVPAAEVRDDLERIAKRRAVLELTLEQANREPVLLHPNMAGIYRRRVAALRSALGREDWRTRAAEIMRSLIERIELTPVRHEGKETLSITLRGDLAGILALAANKKGPLVESDPVLACTKVVAGGGFEPPTFRL